MASDTSLINGVSTESLSPIIDASFALIAAMVIGFTYCWQMSLIMLGLIPFLAIAAALGAQM
jgi:ABC-type multidrug transport system fused ATPase/permease subunit